MTSKSDYDDDDLAALINELKGLILSGFEAVNYNFDRLEDRVDRLEARLDSTLGPDLSYEH